MGHAASKAGNGTKTVAQRTSNSAAMHSRPTGFTGIGHGHVPQHGHGTKSAQDHHHPPHGLGKPGSHARPHSLSRGGQGFGPTGSENKHGSPSSSLEKRFLLAQKAFPNMQAELADLKAGVSHEKLHSDADFSNEGNIAAHVREVRVLAAAKAAAKAKAEGKAESPEKKVEPPRRSGALRRPKS